MLLCCDQTKIQLANVTIPPAHTKLFVPPASPTWFLIFFSKSGPPLQEHAAMH